MNVVCDIVNASDHFDACHANISRSRKPLINFGCLERLPRTGSTNGCAFDHRSKKMVFTKKIT